MSNWLEQAAAKGLPKTAPAGAGSVLDEIAAGRKRQIGAEGRTPESDDRLVNGELLNSAILSAQTAKGGARNAAERRAGIVKAVLFLVAEIERMDRAAGRTAQP